MVPQPIATEPRPYDEAAIAEGQGDTASGQPVVPQPRPLQLPVLAWLREPGRRVILASASPRRKELLGQVCASALLQLDLKIL